MRRADLVWLCGVLLVVMVAVAFVVLLNGAVDERRRINAEAGLERITTELARYPVPGGWVYSTASGLCFVPDDSVEAGR